jgi:hypothetical protein
MTAALLKSKCVVPQEDREANIRAIMARGLPTVTKFLPERVGEKIAIVASGPSVRDYRDELINFDGPVWAINGAYDFLVEEFGRIPDGFVGVDPQPEMRMHLSKPKKATTFYLASSTHPSVIDLLEGYNVCIWHSASDAAFNVLKKGDVVIPGGPFCVTRAPFLARVLGWRDVHIYGVDCAYRDGDSHLTEGQEWRVTDQDRPLIAVVNGQEFLTKAPWMQQASWLGDLPGVFDGKITYRTGGMLPAYLASERSLEGLVTPEELEAALNG